jgi:hypothetical protein
MPLTEIMSLSAIGAVLALIWFALIRASVRRGGRCGTSRCKLGTPAEEEQATERKDC